MVDGIAPSELSSLAVADGNAPSELDGLTAAGGNAPSEPSIKSLFVYS